MDRNFAKSQQMTEHDSRTYLAWSNSYSRLLRQLGLKGAAERAPSLADLLANSAAERVKAAQPATSHTDGPDVPHAASAALMPGIAA